MNILKPFGTEGFILGIGIAALGYLLGPTIKRGARGIAVKGMQGAMMVGDTANDAMDSGKEKFNDFIQNMMDSKQDNERNFHKELIDEIKTDRHNNNELLKELVSTMKSLQNEVKDMKKVATSQPTKTATKTTTTK
ncbi:MAG: hypothetical protein MJA82_10860 [Clostridia bacterium]|nr:hypothetical protein [Clostridia bacterium]